MTDRGVVTTKDWRRCGYVDGRNGNPKWAPDDAASRAAYLRGYAEGKADKIATK